jgi:hypothetical protein
VGYLQKDKQEKEASKKQETSEAEAKAAAAPTDPAVPTHIPARHSIMSSLRLPPLPPAVPDGSAGNVRQARTLTGTWVSGGVS